MVNSAFFNELKNPRYCRFFGNNLIFLVYQVPRQTPGAIFPDAGFQVLIPNLDRSLSSGVYDLF
jgi:hypothetical protein